MKKQKTLGKLKQAAQKIFNAFIRQRDEAYPCISCGEYKPLQSGHYFPCSTHDGVRFDEDNVHGECAYCNCFNEGHLIGYGENLPGRIGVERFEALKQRAADYKKFGHKWSRSELEEIIQTYK